MGGKSANNRFSYSEGPRTSNSLIVSVSGIAEMSANADNMLCLSISAIIYMGCTFRSSSQQ
jgi:hypothetical protein